MRPLENPAESPCFGCGPLHARGLRLQFARATHDGRDVVECRYSPRSDEIGWPGLMHTGLHYTTLMETSYWAALELGGRVHAVGGPQTFDQKRLPRVGSPFVARAWLVGRDPLRTRAESVSIEGKPLGALDMSWKPVLRADVARWGVPLPEYLMTDIPS